MDNMEDVLMELNSFEKASPAPEKIPAVLEQYLVSIAKTGDAHFPWSKIKPVFRAKIQSVIEEFHTVSPATDLPPVPNVDPFSFAECKEKLFQQLDCFAGVPFTVQRLSELLTVPRKHYKRTDKFMRALEKTLLVVSTVAPVRPEGGAVDGHRPSVERDSGNTLIPNGDHVADGEDAADDDDDDNNRGEKEKKDSRHEDVGASTSSLDKDDCGDETKDSDQAVPLQSDKTLEELEPLSEDSKTGSEADKNSEEKPEASESCVPSGDSSCTSEPKSTAAMEIDEVASDVNPPEESIKEESVDAAEIVPNGTDSLPLEKEASNPEAASEESMDAASEDGETPRKRQRLGDDLEQGEPIRSSDEAESPVSQDDAIVPASVE